MTGNLRVALSGDFLRSDGSPAYPEFDLNPLQMRSDIDLFYLENFPVICSKQVEDVDALVISDAGVNHDSFHPNGRLAVIARFGVGYDKIDVDSCSSSGVAFVITSDGVRRPVAASILTLLLALTGRLIEKARIARQGPEGWNRAVDYQGTGLVGKTLGSIGLGNIGAEMFRLAAPLGMHAIATDPNADPAVAKAAGVELVDLNTVVSKSDILAINCPLLPSTRHLMNSDRLALMKPTAYLINTARGGIVDQAALVETLRTKRIAGAALDVLDPEPPPLDDPILALDNVLITPHSLCWTDQLSSGCAEAAVTSVLTVFAGREPRGIVNREILQNPTWRKKLDRFVIHERMRN
jgi:phosphoglycerate dehydrogenase-like enzyme